MDHPNTQALHGYWNELRAGRDAPYRSEIDPRRIRGALETMFILETTAEGGLRFRLAGTRLCELAGEELRGKPAETLMIFGHERELTTLARRALGEPGIGMMRLRAEHAREPGAESWGGEAILLPMRSELGEMTRILGAVNLTEPPRRSRGPLDLRLRCLGSRMLAIDVDPDLALNELDDRPFHHRREERAAAAAGMHEEGAAFLRADQGERPSGPPALTTIEGSKGAGGEKPRNRGHLRLVTD